MVSSPSTSYFYSKLHLFTLLFTVYFPCSHGGRWSPGIAPRLAIAAALATVSYGPSLLFMLCFRSTRFST
ncbi:hypothetical protein KC360_g166 [Hortaea werneckii]|nr:hypothetical protein KC344_g168 [Hortaea werneckii]KAI7180487.1 hypothetical protein KC360_g166 [Hortaea werneckii]